VNKALEMQALRGITRGLQKGEVGCIIGPAGPGKSTRPSQRGDVATFVTFLGKRRMTGRQGEVARRCQGREGGSDRHRRRAAGGPVTRTAEPLSAGGPRAVGPPPSGQLGGVGEPGAMGGRVGRRPADQGPEDRVGPLDTSLYALSRMDGFMSCARARTWGYSGLGLRQEWETLGGRAGAGDEDPDGLANGFRLANPPSRSVSLPAGAGWPGSRLWRCGERRPEAV
jgi:hypothetical protein